MNVEMIYPEVPRHDMFLLKLRRVLRLVFLLAIIVCPIVNIAVGGKAWSAVVVWCILIAWNIFVSPDVIEFGLMRQGVKMVLFAAVLQILIDQLLIPGWAGFVIPLFGTGALIFTAVIFVTDIHTQKQNMMPMIWLIFLALIFFIMAQIGWPELNWPMIVLGSTAWLLTFLGVIIFHKDLLLELKKRFHLQ